MNRRPILIVTAAMAVAAVLVAAIWFALAPRGPAGSGTALVGGPFTLTAGDGSRVSDADFRGKLMLVYFGYTYCPDVCPGELQVMGAALDMLGEDAADVVPVFITVDPERDDAATMAEYVPNFHERMVGLTGTAEEIAAAARAYRVYYARVEPEVEGGVYLMDHSSIVYLMGRDGAYLRHFAYGTPPETMAAGIAEEL
jgi:protein SCO1/2